MVTGHGYRAWLQQNHGFLIGTQEGGTQLVRSKTLHTLLAQGFVPEFLESIRARGAHRCYQMLWFHQAFIEQCARARDALLWSPRILTRYLPARPRGEHPPLLGDGSGTSISAMRPDQITLRRCAPSSRCCGVAPRFGHRLARPRPAPKSAETLYRWLHGGYMSRRKKKPRYRFDSRVSLFHGGEGGIRTLGDVATTPDFESGTFDHSATSPVCRSLRL